MPDCRKSAELQRGGNSFVLAKTVVALCAVALVGVASAATNYIVPWYANPTATNVTYNASLVTSLDESAAPLSTAWATVSAATNFTETVVAKRMSHTTYFRPRVYALLDTGDVIAWTLTNDCTNVKWTTVLTAAELATAAGVSAGSIATDLQVTDDGRIAFLNYGGTYKAIANTPPRWEFRIVDGNGDLVTDPDVAFQIFTSAPSANGCAYITDGKHELYCNRANWTRIQVGQKGSTAQGNAYRNDYSSEVLDFSYGYAELANASVKIDANNTITQGYKSEIYGYTVGYLGSTETVREPRIFIESRKVAYAYNNRGAWTGVEEVVIDSTSLTGGYFVYYPGCVQRLVMNLPNCGTLDTGRIAFNGGLSESSFDEICLPALTNLNKQAIKETKAKGKLDLPSVQHIVCTATQTYETPLGNNVNMTELSLSAEKKMLEDVCWCAFLGDSALKRITLGGVSGFAMHGDKEFQDCTALEDVIFTGGAPTFDDGVEYVFDDRSEKQLVFAIPRNSFEWDAFLGEGNVTEITPEEARTFKVANPDRPIPFGVVDASVFRTHYNQYIGYADQTDAKCSLTIDRNTFFDDSVTVASDIPAGSNGKYFLGTTITLTAVPGTTGTFKKWYGDVPKANQTDSSVTFTIDDDVWIYARFVHPWTLSADKATATDGNFTINVTGADATTHTLTIGAKTSAGLLAASDTGTGVIDLGGPIYLEGDDAPWTFTQLASAKGSQTAPLARDGQFRAYISPGTLESRGLNQVLHRGDSPNFFGAYYKMIVIDEPRLNGSELTDFLMANQTQTETLILDLPSATRLKARYIGYTMSLSNTKFDWWNLSSVSSVTNVQFHWQWGSKYDLNLRLGAKGTLSLPSLREVDWVENDGTQLFMMTNVAAIALGGKDYATTVTNLCVYAFAGNTHMKKLVLHADANMQVGTRIFADHTYNSAKSTEEIDGVTHNIGNQTANGRIPDEIHFTGKAISQAAIDNLLADAVAAEKKPVKIYASRYQQGWDLLSPVSWIDRNPSNFTAEDRELAYGEKIIGVYRGGAEAPLGKALIIHRPNEWDKKLGLSIFIR